MNADFLVMLSRAKTLLGKNVFRFSHGCVNSFYANSILVDGDPCTDNFKVYLANCDFYKDGETYVRIKCKIDLVFDNRDEAVELAKAHLSKERSELIENINKEFSEKLFKITNP